MYFANFQLSTVRDRWTILQNTYRKSAKWVISEAKGIITSPSEEYYIHKFFVHYNIEKANSNCSNILPLSRPCIKEACLLVNIFQKDSKCSFTLFFHHSIYGVKGSQSVKLVYTDHGHITTTHYRQVMGYFLFKKLLMRDNTFLDLRFYSQSQPLNFLFMGKVEKD